MSTNDAFSWGADTHSRIDSGHQDRVERASRRTSLLGARLAAVIIDGLVLLVPVLAVAWALSLAFPHHGFFFSKDAVSVSSSGARTANYHLALPGFLVISAVSLSYFFLYEALRGQTIGKRAMRLRVCSASGGRAGLNSISARTVLRLIDALPFLYLLGTLVALFSGSRRRRIGDWAAGTVVVHEEDAPGNVSRRLSLRVALYPALWVLAVLFSIFALGLGKAAGQREQAFAHYPDCAAAGISTPEGHEGLCVRIGASGTPTVYNVVDRSSVLRMPEYEARVLGSQITPTRVPNASENPGLYPDGRGQLVSFQVIITNSGRTPLSFGEVPEQAVPSYPRQPTIELALPTPPESSADVAYPAILNGRRAPTPSIFQGQPIAPYGRRVGWVSFVAPAWAPSVLEARPADIDFLRTDGGSSYVGQLRLWK
jgi:uncharacterized RDD family membrane protein YckC